MFQPLADWFLQEGRDLPWRRERSPYSTWVSEVMLQQTQVSVVVPYFLRWLERFPSIEALAAAPWEEVVKFWEGLGYYSRAKNLHQGAKEVVARYQGQLPNNYASLLSIRGIGPYTAGAILSFAFQQKKGAIDGNVARVLSRLFLVDTTHAELLKMLEEHLPDHQPWIVQEGLIELGALLCQRKAKCSSCPMKSSCLAHREGKTELFPKKKPRPAITPLYRQVAVIESEQSLLFQRGKEGKVMGYLHEFPYVEEASLSSLESLFAFPLTLEGPLTETTHSFTRYRVTLAPFHYLAEEHAVPAPYIWVKKEDLNTIALSSGHRRILQQWLTSFT